MSKKPTQSRISKADDLVKGADIELSEEELKRISGGYSEKFLK